MYSKLLNLARGENLGVASTVFFAYFSSSSGGVDSFTALFSGARDLKK